MLQLGEGDAAKSAAALDTLTYTLSLEREDGTIWSVAVPERLIEMVYSDVDFRETVLERLPEQDG